jgi:XTP/dITP diphosphohydrolase
MAHGAMGERRFFVLADDSGLCVDHLGGAPGVRSARYAGEGADSAARNAKLLRALEGVPRQNRGARFICVAAVICPDGGVRICEGRCDGSILEAPAGQGGFGYDPVFYVEGLGRSMAELSFEEKNRASHRGKAARAAARAIAGWIAENH